jgi:hypothetical protein
MAQAMGRTGQVLTDLTDLMLPLIIALGAGLTLWVVLEMARARRRLRRRVKVPEWQLPADATARTPAVQPRRVRSIRHPAGRPEATPGRARA